MSCYDVNQLEVGLHSLQLSATSSTSVHNFTHSSMNVDIQLMPQSMVAKQDNQNAAALSAEEGITKLLSRTKYLIAQENGQRRYGPPPDWKGETPLRGCEVFVGKIPRDCFEDELIPIFERIGPIYMFRLMMEFNGTNRGYGFCVYTNREDTKRAIDELNNYEIRKGKMIGVCLSVDNCRLFVGGIPKNKTREEIFIEMLKVTEGVKDVISYPSVADKTKNRGFAFVEYESHKSAAMARRKLMPGRIQLWGQQIAVDWAEPEREVNEDIMSKVKILYVRNLMLSTTEEQLREYFINLAGGDDQKIERVKKISDYAFVHFQDRDIALMCMEKLNGTQIDGSTIEVTWAKPADKGDPTKTQVARSGKQFMDWNLSTDFTNTSNIFLDPTATLLPGNNSGTSFLWPFDNGVSQLVVPGSGNGTSRTGRRNAAGGRSAAAQRERKHPVEKLQQHQSNPLVYWEALDDICKSYGLELPIYTALPVDIIDITTGGKVQLFAGQVTVPSMRMQCITPRYYSTMEEAKVGAAETAIHNLQYSQMQAAISEHPLQTRWNLDPTSNELHSASVLMSPVPPSTTMPTFSQNSPSDSVHRGHNYRERTRNNAFCQTKRTHSSKTDSEFDNGELTTANGKSNLRSVCSSENLRPDSGATTCDTAFSALDEPCPSLNNNNGYGLIDYPFDSMTQHVLHPELGLAGQPQYIYQSNIDGQPIPHLIQPPPSVAPYYGGLTHLASGDNGMQMGMYFNCPSSNKNSNLVYTSPQTGCLQSHDANCYQQMSLNGSYASQVPSSRCNSSSLLPMVLPQGMQQRNMTFPSMSCPSGLYQSAAGSMAGGFSPLIPLSTDENGVPINPMPNIQLPNQLFDYPSHLISNQLATSNLLSCGGLISAGTLIMDPNNINTPSSIIGGANQNTTSSAGPILGHPSSLGDYMPKPSVQNNAINSVIQFNSQSNLGNLLPMLQPITSIQAPVSVAGPANYRLQLSTCVPSAIGQSTLMPVHSSLNSLTTISASNNLISSLNNTSPLSQA